MDLGAEAGPYTVAFACRDYLKHYAAKGGKSEYFVKQSMDVHVLPALGEIEIAKLTTRKLRDWHHGLAATPRRVRTSKFSNVQNMKTFNPDEPDKVRSRRATANRILTVLKAALNHVYQERYVSTDDAWRAAKPFKSVEAPGHPVSLPQTNAGDWSVPAEHGRGGVRPPRHRGRRQRHSLGSAGAGEGRGTGVRRPGDHCRPPSHARTEWIEKFAAMAIDRPALKGLAASNKAQWLKPEIRVRAQHLKAKGTLRHATVKALLPD